MPSKCLKTLMVKQYQCTSDKLIDHIILIPLRLRLLSTLNTFFYVTRKYRRFSRKNYHEKPALSLTGLTSAQKDRIQQLKNHYGVHFESFFNEGNSLENYHLLDLLDQFKTSTKTIFLPKQKLADVGCKNFYYAPTLDAFFKPAQVTGIELDAFGLYQNFHTRFSYARYYLSTLPHFHFHAGDFCQWTSEPLDGITFFYPFVIPEPLIRWNLPLSEFKPIKIFQQAQQLLKNQGWLFIVNQGPEEFEAQIHILSSLKFKKVVSWIAEDLLLSRNLPPHVSLWKKQPVDRVD